MQDDVAIHAHAFHRPAPLLPRQMRDRGTGMLGDVDRLRHKLNNHEPVTMVALGASNTVRGGCQQWQQKHARSKCAQPKYTNRSADGTPRGWLLQAFEAMERHWPHPQHKLVNNGLMATGPAGFDGCLNRFVPLEADVVLLSFADVCASHTAARLQPRGCAMLPTQIRHALIPASPCLHTSAHIVCSLASRCCDRPRGMIASGVQPQRLTLA